MERCDRMALLFREEFVCPYIHDGRTAQVEYLLPSDEEVRNFDQFLSKGYRRLETIFYRNLCEGCSSCIPIRLSVRDFVLSKSQRRTLRENEEITVVTLHRPMVTAEKIYLYERYIRTKHGQHDESDVRDPEQALRTMHYGFENTLEMDYFLDRKLIGVGIVDEGNDALSSNYFYYNTDVLERRPGIFSVIQEIFLAQRLKKRFFYLGFYIAETEKMSYKKYFRPNQILRNGRWEAFLQDLV